MDVMGKVYLHSKRKMELASLYLHMSGNGEQPHVDLFVVFQRILSTHLRNDGQDTRYISIVCPKNNHTVTARGIKETKITQTRET